MPLHAFALWNPFGEHPPYRIGAPDRRQFWGTIKWRPSRSTQNLTFVWHIFGFFLKHVEARCKKPSNPIKSHQIPTYHHISCHIISSDIPTIKLGTAVSAAEAAEAASTVPLHAFALWDPVGEHAPYRIGAPDRRQFLGTIKWQPSRSTQNLTFVWHIFGFFLKHVEARCKKPSNPIKSHQIPTYHHISFHIISSHIPTIRLGTAVSAAEAAEPASTVPLHAFASWNPFGVHPPL